MRRARASLKLVSLVAAASLVAACGSGSANAGPGDAPDGPIGPGGFPYVLTSLRSVVCAAPNGAFVGLTHDNRFRYYQTHLLNTAEPKPLPGGRDARVVAMNASGLLVGVCRVLLPPTGEEQFVPIYWPRPAATPLRVALHEGVVNPSRVSVTAVNDHGHAVGYEELGQRRRPLYWSSLSQPPRELPASAVGVVAWGAPRLINDNGLVVGEVGGPTQCGYWRTKNGFQPPKLFLPYGQDAPLVYGLNNKDECVGTSKYLGSGRPLYFASPEAEPSALIAEKNPLELWARDINASSIIVGGVTRPGVNRALCWRQPALANPVDLQNKMPDSRYNVLTARFISRDNIILTEGRDRDNKECVIVIKWTN